MTKHYALLLLLVTCIFSLNAQITAFPDTSICPGDNVTLGSDLVDFCGDCYTYEEIPFDPAPIAGTALTMVDDTYIGPFPIGFSFCFFGEEYTQFYVSSNGWISFLEPTTAWSINWTPDGPVPDAAANVPKAAIYCPWTDWNTGLCTDCIHYETIGVAPNRAMVVTWDGVPLFSCVGEIGTFQIILRETSNFIDNHLTYTTVCPTWDLGIATQGLENQDGSIAFTVTGRNATAWSATDESYRWYTSDVEWFDDAGTLIGTGPEVDVAPDVTTTYTLVQTLCDGTVYTDDVTVTVGAAFDATVSTTDITCGGDNNGTASIDLTGGIPPYTYEWSTGATGVTSVSGLDGGTYTVTVTEAGGCSRTYTFTIVEPEDLTATVENLVNNPCNGYSEGSVHINATGGTPPYSYSLNGDAPTIIDDFSGLAAGEYTVLVTDANGCTTEVSFTITEPILLTADAVASDASIFVGQSTTITVETSLPNINSVTWDPDVPCIVDPCLSTTVSPTTTTTYVVTVTDDQGCVAYDTITIEVEFVPEVFFPSAFSPNGDGTNDLFQSVGYNITSYDLKIYNRWGQMLYETSSFDPAAGWNGTYNNEDQNMGTYVWQVNVGFVDGQVYSDTGNFILVR